MNSSWKYLDHVDVRLVGCQVQVVISVLATALAAHQMLTICSPEEQTAILLGVVYTRKQVVLVHLVALPAAKGYDGSNLSQASFTYFIPATARPPVSMNNALLPPLSYGVPPPYRGLCPERRCAATREKQLFVSAGNGHYTSQAPTDVGQACCGNGSDERKLQCLTPSTTIFGGAWASGSIRSARASSCKLSEVHVAATNTTAGPTGRPPGLYYH